MVLPAISLLMGFSIAVVIWAILDIMLSEERRVARRLRALSDAERLGAAGVEPLTLPFAQRVLRPAGSEFLRGLRGVAPKDYHDRLQVRCRTAGFPGGMDADSLLIIKFAVGVAVLGTVVLLSLVAANDVGLGILFAFVLGALAWFLPDIWLSGRATHRQGLLRRALPDMLDMLTIAVEAGLGFDAAVTKYVRNSSGPLAEEFGVALREIQAGLSRREALRNLAERCDVPELSAFVMAMVQADVFGVSVGSVLRTQSREIRIKRRQHAEEIAQKAPAKMVFPLVLCILPATLIVLMTPAVINIARAFGAFD